MNSTVSVRMKRACVVVMVVLAVCSCFAKTSVDRVAALKDRVSEIYTNLYEGELEERYCSEAYLEVYNAVVSADKELDEVGFLTAIIGLRLRMDPTLRCLSSRAWSCCRIR